MIPPVRKCVKHYLKAGVTLTNRKKNPFKAQISINGKQTYIGCYPTEDEAHEAYLNRYRELHSTK